MRSKRKTLTQTLLLMAIERMLPLGEEERDVDADASANGNLMDASVRGRDMVDASTAAKEKEQRLPSPAAVKLRCAI